MSADVFLIDIHCPSPRSEPRQVRRRIIRMPRRHAYDISFLPSMGLVYKLSHHGFAGVTTRADGDVYGACDEPDDARSARVAAQSQCDPFATVY
jgi:hypothetical protein